ncbi:MAG: hypothetical protein PHQ44_00545 [Anaerovibrio sp.]|nr:hypothetical protein [Anaerovibrio sp.]
MTTEILGFIIILGAVIVLLARKQLNKAEDDPEVLEAATGRLRYELEQSADEIISRMTEHVDRLERMLREADYKAELLRQRMEQLQALQDRAELPSRAADTESEGAEAEAVQWSAEAPVGEVPIGETNDAVLSAPVLSAADEQAWECIREASMKLEAQYEVSANTMQEVQQADALQQAVDIQAGSPNGLVVSAVPESYAADAGENENILDTETAAAQARAMLEQGYELEAIARATGLGIGAVHLIRQMQER